MTPKYRIYRQADGWFIIKKRWLCFWFTVEHDFGPLIYDTIEAAEKDIFQWHRARPTLLVKEIRL